MAGFCTASFASVISPSETSVTLPKGTNIFSFDVILDADSDFAGAEFGLQPSSSDVEFEKITFSQELSGESQVKTVKDGILYFGFFASENKYAAGKHTVATVTYRYSGTADRSVRLAESKIVTVSEAGQTSGDTTTPSFTVTVTRSDDTGNPGGGSGGSGSSGGGGGIDGSGSDEKHSITVSSPQNGMVTVSPESASEGETVTITTSAEEGYETDGITVIGEDGEKIAVTGSGTEYTFVMPSSDVTVSAVFRPSSGGAGHPFTDVASDAWYADAVTYAYENGLMNGTSETSFSPALTTTRGMIVTMLYRLEGEPAAQPAGFTDVSVDKYYASAIDWAEENDIVNGYGNGRFGPEDPITREQMAAILYRYAFFKECDVSASSALNGYADTDQISDYALPALQWAHAESLVNGVSDTSLNPKGDATRAEIAAIMTRFCENILR